MNQRWYLLNSTKSYEHAATQMTCINYYLVYYVHLEKLDQLDIKKEVLNWSPSWAEKNQIKIKKAIWIFNMPAV